MHQNFSKSKILHGSSKLEHFQLGGGGGRGGEGFWTSKRFRFPIIIIFVIFWTGSKNLLDYLEKKYGNIGDISAVLLRYF